MHKLALLLGAAAPVVGCGSQGLSLQSKVEQGTMEVLRELNLIKEAIESVKSDYSAAEKAFGAGTNSPTVCKMLNKEELRIQEIDCRMHRIAKQLSQLEVEDKQQANVEAQKLKTLHEKYLEIQATLEASCLLMIEALDGVDTATARQKLVERIAQCQDFDKERYTLLPHEFTDDQLIPLPIHKYFSHLHSCPGCQGVDMYLYIKGNDVYVMPNMRYVFSFKSDADAVGTLDLGSEMLLALGEGNTFYGWLKDQEGRGTLVITQGEQNIDCADGSSIGTLLLSGPIQNLETRNAAGYYLERPDNTLQSGTLIKQQHNNADTGGLLRIGATRSSTLKTNTTTVSSGTLQLGGQGTGTLETDNLCIEGQGTLVLGTEEATGQLRVTGRRINDGLIYLNRISNFPYDGWEGTGTLDLGDNKITVGSYQTLSTNLKLTSNNTDYEKEVIYLDNVSTLNAGEKVHPLIGCINFKNGTWKYINLIGRFPHCVVRGYGNGRLNASSQTCECRALLNETDLIFGDNTDIIITYGLEYDDFRSNRAFGKNDANGRLIKRGAGRQILNALGSRLSNRTGETRVEGGTLSGPVWPNAPLFVADGATYQICCYNGESNVTGTTAQTVLGLRGDGVVELGDFAAQKPGNLTVNVAAGTEETFDGQLKGTGSLIKSGAGTQILTAEQPDFAGTLSVQGGRLALNHIPENVTSAQITDGAELSFNLTEDTTFEGVITGNGTLTLTASQPVTFTWPQRDAFTGTLNVDENVTIITE